MTADQIATFQAVSGVTPAVLNYTTRTFVGAAFLIWALWMTFSCLHQLRKERNSVIDIKFRLIRVCVVVMVGLILIAS